MTDTLLLRFRDHQEGIDTISEHVQIARERGHVWWGWWKKESEPDRSRVLGELSEKARTSALEIGLFDRSTDRYFFAIAADFVQSRGAPERDRTPPYYAANINVTNWVRLLEIQPTTADQFVERFGAIPEGEHTLFPLSRGQPKNSAVPPEYSRLTSDVVVQVSDLHFGDDHGFPRSAALGRETVINRLRADLENICDGQVGLIIVSGDLTTKGDANTLQIEGLNFLNALHRELGVPKEAILVVPGNHDFRLMNYEPTDFSHERPFNLMLREFYGRYDPNERLRRFVFPSGHHAEFLLINSVRLRKKEESNYGYVEWSLYEGQLRDRPKDEGVTRVAILHHHLISIAKEEFLDRDYPQAGISTTIDSGAVIEGLQAHRFRLALHGHQHLPGMAHISRGVLDRDHAAIPRPNLAVLSAGSAGAKAERLTDSLRDNSYNLIRFRRDELHVEARRFNAGLAASRYFLGRVAD